jgi:hypothetical protein
MRRYYYCLIAGLPEVFFDQQKLTLSLVEFKEELHETLHPDDYELVKLLFLNVDNENLLNLLLHNDKPFRVTGNYSRDTLEEGIRDPEILEGYMKVLIDEFREAGGAVPPQGWENRLAGLWYDTVRKTSNLFLSDWLNFSLMLNDILAAHNSRKWQYDMENELIGDEEIITTMRRSQARDFGIMAEVPFVERVVTILEEKNLLQREKNIDQLKWRFLDELTTFEYFTIEVILSYIIKMTILARWIPLDAGTGKAMFEKLNQDMKRGAEFSTEYQINERR